MSVTLYDKAVTEKIKSWILDTDMIVFGPDETRRMFMYKADVSNDKPLKLPMITVTRGRDISIRDRGKRPQSYMGKVFNSAKGVSDHLNAIPISIPYVLNIFTRTEEQADEYVRNFVFNIVNYPSILIKIPYNGSNLSYTSFITLGDTFTDASDIPERLISGQFSRFVLPFVLNDAYLFSYNHRKIPNVTGVDIIPQNPNSGNSSTGSSSSGNAPSGGNVPSGGDAQGETDGFEIKIII